MATLWAVGLLVLLVAGISLYAWQGGTIPAGLSISSLGATRLLAASGPQEATLRTLRLAGFESGAVGSDRGAAVVRLDVPGASSAADVEIAWQTATAALVAAYPRAERYVVQVTAGGEGFAEVVLEDGGAVRDAVASDDAALVFELASVRLVVADDAATADLPSDSLVMGTDVSVLYLDAKNRAAGLLDDDGPLGGVASELETAVEATRRAVPGIPAPGPDESAAALYAKRIESALAVHPLEGADSLLAWIDSLDSTPSRDNVASMRAWTLTVEALASDDTLGSVLAGTHSAGKQVLRTPLAIGPASDAMLAAADSDSAPPEAMVVRRFRRAASLDVDTGSGIADTSSEELPVRVLRLHGSNGTPTSLTWVSGGERMSVAPESWIARKRADGSVFWLAGERGEVALTDVSTHGWAFSRTRAALVDASRCGRVLAVFPPE